MNGGEGGASSDCFVVGSGRTLGKKARRRVRSGQEGGESRYPALGEGRFKEKKTQLSRRKQKKGDLTAINKTKNKKKEHADTDTSYQKGPGKKRLEKGPCVEKHRSAPITHIVN